MMREKRHGDAHAGRKPAHGLLCVRVRVGGEHGMRIAKMRAHAQLQAHHAVKRSRLQAQVALVVQACVQERCDFT
jgi:hypothetical protein